MRRHPRRIVLLAAVAAFAAAPCRALAQDGGSETIEALFSLVQFTSWRGPLSLTDDVVVCTLGRDPLGRGLDTLAGRPTRGRRIVVRRFVDPASARGCHVVFVGPTMRRGLRGTLRRLRGGGALTVGVFPDFARRGGMVRLIEGEERVQLEVNRAALEAEGVRLSARVLRIARLI